MGSRFQADDLIDFFLFSLEPVLLPTFRNLDKSFETWQYENRFRLQIRRIHKRKWISCKKGIEGPIFQLTRTGRIKALGGRDPVKQWDRPWDAKWRFIFFDLPARKRSLRKRFLKWLRKNQFGYLQHSVWITPDPLDDVIRLIQDFGKNTDSLAIIEGSCSLGATDADFVSAAWDFAEINHRYEAYIDSAKKMSCRVERPFASLSDLLDWIRRERLAWLRAISLDPLLPRALHPRHYLGPKAWNYRLGLQNRLQTFF